jgi:ATP-dependent RNA helicase RhlE
MEPTHTIEIDTDTTLPIAEPLGTFEELGLCEEGLAAVRDAGYKEPTPIQRQAIPLALSGRDLIGLANTGTGKTAAFTLPIINRLVAGPKRTRVLILTPTRELAAQVEDSFRKYGKHSGLSVVPVFGGIPIEPQERALRAGVDVVVATPGRLIDHVERQNVNFDDLEVLVLDEADRMLDMGFAPQINRIVNEIPRYRQTLLFSATMPPEVEALARKYLRKPVVVQVGRRSSAASTVAHAVYPVPRDKKSALLVELRRRWIPCSSSLGRSMVRIAWCDISNAVESQRRQCTPINRRPNGRRPWRASRAARSAFSSPPTLRSVGSTSRVSRT